MTSRTAHDVADLVLVSAGVAVVFVVITTPPLRRLAGTAIRVWLGASLPVYLLREARRAWLESAAAA